MDQLILRRVPCIIFVNSKSTDRIEKKIKIPYISCTNLNKSNLFPILFLFLGKGDIYSLKYRLRYQVPGQY